MPKKTGISSRLSAFFSGSKKREAGAKKENREQINNPSRHLALSLKGVFDKFLRKTTVSLRTLAKCGIDAKEERIYVVPFGKYIEELPSPSFIAIFYITEWSSFVILRIEEGLLDPLIEALLGGGTYEQQGKKTDIATQIERTLLERIVNAMFSDFAEIFSGFTELHYNLDRVEFIPDFAKIASSASETIVLQAKFEIGSQNGIAEFAIPHAAFSHLQDDFPILSEEKTLALEWQEHFKAGILTTSVELCVVLRNMSVPLQEVLTWGIGTYIPLGIAPGSPVNVFCKDKVFFAGTLGRQAQFFAVQIQNVCKEGGFL